jgi:hypothetical protein
VIEREGQTNYLCQPANAQWGGAVAHGEVIHGNTTRFKWPNQPSGDEHSESRSCRNSHHQSQKEQVELGVNRAQGGRGRLLDHDAPAQGGYACVARQKSAIWSCGLRRYRKRSRVAGRWWT